MEKSYQKNKNIAIKLRKKGYSYNLILKEVRVAKSTLSIWLRDIPYAPSKQVLNRIKLGPYLSGKKA